METEKVVHPQIARNAKYRELLEGIAAQGECPFCGDNLQRIHTKPILYSVSGWVITENAHPYPASKHHFLLVGPKHITHPSELIGSDWNALSQLVSWACDHYEIKGGGFAMRFGEPTHTGASVTHLHAHLIVPDVSIRSWWQRLRYRMLGLSGSNAVEFPIGRRDGNYN